MDPESLAVQNPMIAVAEMSAIHVHVPVEVLMSDCQFDMQVSDQTYPLICRNMYFGIEE